MLLGLVGGQFVVPATFYGNGLALHRELDDDGYVLAHVSSGLKLRGRMKLTTARKMAALLADSDWTFHKDAVMREHADLVRSAFEQASGYSFALSAHV